MATNIDNFDVSKFLDDMTKKEPISLENEDEKINDVDLKEEDEPTEEEKKQGFKLDLSNPEMMDAYDTIEHTYSNLFLTGKAGSGKTTFLKWLMNNTKKNYVVLAPTGVAAINVCGQTIHSFFGIEPGLFTPTTLNNDGKTYTPGSCNPSRHTHKKDKKILLENLDLIIIDEVSMVRGDLLDCVSDCLCYAKKSTAPFGGTQLLLVGDLFQLPPVVSSAEKDFYKLHYDSEFFFSSIALRNSEFKSIQLKKIYRQSDPVFINILNNIRLGILIKKDIETLNTRYRPRLSSEKFSINETILCSTKRESDINNMLGLSQIKSPEKVFEAEVTGIFPDSKIPCDKYLKLKVGARVMLTENNWEDNYQNGSIAIVTDIGSVPGLIEVELLKPKKKVHIQQKIWENIEYIADAKGNAQKVTVGECRQYPIRLAYSITIHKSQGLTFDQITIDPKSIFADGQLYVALSRARSLDGIRLLSPVRGDQVRVNNDILNFYIDQFGIENLIDE